MAELIFMRLEGPLQSWGENAPWDNRGTAFMPTKSAVVGLLGCALGLERGSPELLELSGAVQLGIRADRQGVLTSDFHTLQGSPLRTAEGKPRTTGNTVISTRWYLQDASFLLVLEAEEPWRERICRALQKPKWCMFLGRKSCVPSRPVWAGQSSAYSSLEAALLAYPPADRADEVMTYELEMPREGLSSLSREDVLQSHRQFGLRPVWRGSVRRDALCT